MYNIIKCQNCSKIFIGEEYSEHKNHCLKHVKEIPIIFLVKIDKQDKEVFIAKGLDGVLYRLVKILPTISDESLQQDNEKDNRRQDSSAFIRIKKNLIFFFNKAIY